MDRRSDRRKNDEDIAERVIGGVRIDRSSVDRRQDRSTAPDRPASSERIRDNRDRRPH